MSKYDNTRYRALIVFLVLLFLGCSGGNVSHDVSNTDETNTSSDSTPPILSDTNQTYITTIGVPLTLQTVSATDNVDGNVSVIQGGDSVDFNSVGTYIVTYTATDSANNISMITHTYIVNPLLGDTFPSSYYPSNAHPRLWLTQNRYNDLILQKNSNTEKWRTFKEMCDAIIDNDSSNDPYGLDTSPQNFTAPLSLMYVLTQQENYADKAIALIHLVDTNLSRYGDPDHQDWYYLALSYDWLYDYSGFTISEKGYVTTLMYDLSNQFWLNYNINASGTDSDQNLLTGMMHLAFGAALYGDDVNATTLLDRGWYGWKHGYYTEHGTSNRDMIKSALGGIYFTGMAYFPSTDIMGIASYEMTLRTACSYDINQLDVEIKNFWSNTIYGIINLTEPTKKTISDYGSWQDPNILETQPWMRRMMIVLGYFSSIAGDDTAASLAQGYNEYVDIGYYNDPFIELFFTKSDINSTDPYAAQLPLVTFHNDPDFLLFRTSWDDNALWGEFRGDGAIPLDQQSPDHGHFSLFKNGSYLTKAARNYESLSHGDFFNALSIENGCTLNGENCSGTAIFYSEHPAEISRHFEHNTDNYFAYSMLNADGQWNDNSTEYNPIQNVESYRRHFFWTPKYVVVYDKVRTKVPLDIRYRLRAMQRPIINANVVAQLSENGNAKLLQQTLEPANVVIKELNETKAWRTIDDWVVDLSQRKWQSYMDFNDTTSVNILNLIQIGDANMSGFDINQHLDTSDYSGIRIGSWFINFSKKDNLRDNISYTLSNTFTKMYHFITDMQEGNYVLSINGRNEGVVQVDTTSYSAYFETDTSDHDITISLRREP